MRFRLRELTAALVAAFATTTLAFAQAPAAPAVEPAATAAATPAYADAPKASVATGNQSAHIGAANAIVEAINADTSLKDTKITVTPEETKILLTGVTPTVQQMGQILKLASQHAGDQVVVNGIATEEVFLEPNPTGEAAQTERMADAGEATEGQAAGTGQAAQSPSTGLEQAAQAGQPSQPSEQTQPAAASRQPSA